MSLALSENKSTLVQVMAWCRQATSHYLSQCWPRYVLPYGVIRPQWVKFKNFHCGFLILRKDCLVNVFFQQMKFTYIAMCYNQYKHFWRFSIFIWLFLNADCTYFGIIIFNLSDEKPNITIFLSLNPTFVRDFKNLSMGVGDTSAFQEFIM